MAADAASRSEGAAVAHSSNRSAGCFAGDVAKAGAVGSSSAAGVTATVTVTVTVLVLMLMLRR